MRRVQALLRSALAVVDEAPPTRPNDEAAEAVDGRPAAGRAGVDRARPESHRRPLPRREEEPEDVRKLAG